MKVFELLKEIEQIVEKGNTLPFSSKALVSPEEIIEIVDEIRAQLPKEIEEAKKIVETQDSVINEAQSEAERIKKDAEYRLKELIDTNAITKNATMQAETIVTGAQVSAKELRVGTQHYADKVLYNLQLQLKTLNEEIEKNRKELKTIQ